MLSIDHAGFHKMDQLSEERIPFFFIIDFLMENVLVFTEDEINKKKLLIDFPSFKNYYLESTLNKDIEFKTYPETQKSYDVGFRLVTENLQKGNSYLTNYTRKTPIETNLSLREIFEFSKAKYKVCYQDEFVFFSPETFIEINNQEVSTYPMKGTIDASIENAVELLKSNQKEKAEHYTVVDLLRNDLSMIANNVYLKEFQRIDYLQTKQKNLYAMSSEIVGEVKPNYQNKIGSIMQRLLPAGSILGAPKAKTLEIILEAEQYPRKFYTGVSGWFDGENLDSCVMIRFIEKDVEGKLSFKSGGGITHMSTLEEEYQEMINKIYVPIY